MSLKKKLLLFGGAAFLASLILNSFNIYAVWHSIFPNGSTEYLWLSIFLSPPLLAALALIPISLIGLIFKKMRSISSIVFLTCIAYLIGMFVCGSIAGRVRTNGFRKLAERSSPLVQAIKDYQTTVEHPPESLESLVPNFIDSVPGTGMAAYPDYEYISGEEAEGWDNNPWVLYVKTPSGGINWDMFIYLPKQNYPKRGYGGSLERIQDWAYVHE